MSTYVIDASVMLKWLLSSPASEPDTDLADSLLQSVLFGEHRIVQPPHWLAEVAAVLTRHSPAEAAGVVRQLAAMEVPVTEEPAVWETACAVAIATGCHVFDTLYHAVALAHDDAILVTADERYSNAAQSFGRIATLASLRTAAN